METEIGSDGMDVNDLDLRNCNLSSECQALQWTESEIEHSESSKFSTESHHSLKSLWTHGHPEVMKVRKSANNSDYEVFKKI